MGTHLNLRPCLTLQEKNLREKASSQLRSTSKLRTKSGNTRPIIRMKPTLPMIIDMGSVRYNTVYRLNGRNETYSPSSNGSVAKKNFITYGTEMKCTYMTGDD